VPRHALAAVIPSALAAALVLTPGLFPTASAAHAQAEPPRLALVPASPMAGDDVTVRYQPAEALATDRLVLRARLRAPRHDSYNDGFRYHSPTELRRGPDGAFTGGVRLPDDVVYAVLAVETPAADWADDNGGRPWELVVHGPDGRPLYDALRQRFNDHMGRDMREVLASARSATELYPDRPGGWSLLNAAESWSAGAADTDEAREARRDRSRAAATRIGARADLSADELSELTWLVRGAPEAEAARARLERDHPAHPAVVMDRMFEARRAHGEDHDALLATYDELWSGMAAAGEPADVREEGIRMELAAMALRLAAAQDRPSLVARWTERFQAMAPPDRQAATLLGIPPLREAGIGIARQEIERLRALRPEDRELGQTLDEQRAAHLVAIGRLQGRVGQALVAEGRVDEGAAELREGVARAPVVAFLRDLADAALALDDTDTALDALARVAADPATPPAFADTARQRLGDAFDPDRWDHVRRAALEDLTRTTRARAVHRPLPDLVLATGDGDPLPFARLTDGAQAAVVVFVSRYCGPSTQAMPRIQELARELAEHGVVVLPVTQDPVGLDYPESYREAGVDIPVYHDLAGEASHVFNVWGTPQYFVVDRDGAIRFERTSLTAIPLQVSVILD
jgi:hypothetical protein